MTWLALVILRDLSNVLLGFCLCGIITVVLIALRERRKRLEAMELERMVR